MTPQHALRALLAIVLACIAATAAVLVVTVSRTPQPHAPPSPALPGSQVTVTQRQSATYVAVAPNLAGDGGHRVYIVQPGGMRG